MSTPPLLTLPTSICFASIVMTLNRVVGLTRSPFTLEEQVFKWPGEAWSVEVNLPLIKGRERASEWIAFGLNLEGGFGNFLMGDPLGKVPMGVATGAPLVDGAAQEGTTLLTKGWTSNITGILLAGDYIQLGSSGASRLHMVTQNADSDGSGNAALKIQPALRTSPADSSTIVTHDTVGVFRMSDNDFSWGVAPGKIYKINFRAHEVVGA